MREGWSYKKLGEVCELYQPQTISTEQLVPDGQYSVYGANGIIGKYDKYNHEEKELLLTCRGATCGMINVSEPFSWINGNAMVVHAKDDSITFDYLMYVLKATDWSLVITGAAQPQITRKALSPLKISIAPLTTQHQIVSELDLLSHILDQKRQQLKEYDALAESIFYDMFGDPVENPKGWEVKKLGDVAKIISGFAFPSSKFSDNNPLKAIKITNVGVGEFIEDKSSLPEEYSVMNNYRITKGSIVVALTRTVISSGFKRAYVSTSYDGALLNQRVAALSVVCIEKAFLYTYLGTFYVKEYVLEKSKALMQPNLSVADLRNLPLYYPPLPLQQTFAAKIQSIEHQKQLLKESIKETEMLFQSRMDYWFNG